MTIIKWNGRDVPEALRELAPGEYFVEDAAASQDGGVDEGDACWEDWIAKSVGEDVRATAERVANAAKVTEFDRWVGDNNIPSQYEYGKGWWDYVELIRRFASKHAVEQVRVVGHYVVDTPPPEERLPLPAVALTRGGVLVALKYDFGAGCRWPREWTVSVQRPTPYRGPTLGLFDPSLDLRHANVAGSRQNSCLVPIAKTRPNLPAKSSMSGTSRCCCASSLMRREIAQAAELSAS